MSKKLISVSSLKAAIEAGREFAVSASKVGVIKGYFLNINEGEVEYVLSTWRSSDPKVFKTADNLLKEAESFGFKSVVFELGDNPESA